MDNLIEKPILFGEESLYYSDCEIIGTCGGCGVSCAVFLRNQCPEPLEINVTSKV